MPKPGFRSFTIRESIYADMEKQYKKKARQLERRGVNSMAGYFAALVSAALDDDTIRERLEEMGLV